MARYDPDLDISGDREIPGREGDDYLYGAEQMAGCRCGIRWLSVRELEAC